MGCQSRTRRISQLGVVLTFLGTATVSGQIVVPNGLRNLEGNFDNSIPWNDEAPARYQQIYLGSEVGTLIELNQIKFRQDGEFGEPFEGTIPDVTIVVASTSKAPDELSLVFSENLGPDAMVVYAGPLYLESESMEGPPRTFDITVYLQQVFEFDPSTGLNLLLDVTIPAGPALTNFDAEVATGDSVSRVYCWVFEECLTTDDAMIADSVGLVTMFVDQLIFRDMFESGDTSAWTSTMP